MEFVHGLGRLVKACYSSSVDRDHGSRQCMKHSLKHAVLPF